MKTYWVAVHYDTGLYNEFTIKAENEDEAYDKVYEDIGYDPGDVYVEEITDDQ